MEFFRQENFKFQLPSLHLIFCTRHGPGLCKILFGTFQLPGSASQRYVARFLSRAQVARWVAMVCMAKSCCTVARACWRVWMCIFAVSVVCTKHESWAPVHAGVYIAHVFLTLPYIFSTQSLQGVHMCSFLRSLFIRR